MKDEEIKDFVRRYICEMQNTTSDEVVESSTLEYLADSEPEAAWGLITRSVSESPEMYLDQIGAGPLESLLFAWPQFFGRAVDLARVDAKFREALRYVRGVEPPAEWFDAYEQLWRDEVGS
jgi:hypothetical protein